MKEAVSAAEGGESDRSLGRGLARWMQGQHRDRGGEKCGSTEERGNRGQNAGLD